MPLQRSTRVLLTVWLGSLAMVSAAQGPSRVDADRMAKKVDAVLQRAGNPPARPSPLRTAFTESELNAYLVHHAPDQFPTGVRSVRVTMPAAGTLETRAVVDLDVVRTSQPRSMLDPLAYVTGALEVVMLGALTGAEGLGTFRLQSASVGGLPIPRMVLQELLAFFTRSDEMPRGITLDEPFELPAAIREVQIQRGSAVVVQ